MQHHLSYRVSSSRSTKTQPLNWRVGTSEAPRHGKAAGAARAATIGGEPTIGHGAWERPRGYGAGASIWAVVVSAIRFASIPAHRIEGIRELGPTDIENLAAGAWILGTRGDGNPYRSLPNEYAAAARGLRPVVNPAESLAETDLALRRKRSKRGIECWVGFEVLCHGILGISNLGGPFYSRRLHHGWDRRSSD